MDLYIPTLRKEDYRNKSMDVGGKLWSELPKNNE